METYFLKNEDLFIFYERIAGEYEFYVPVKTESRGIPACEYGFTLPTHDYALRKYSEAKREDIVFNEYRCIEPASRVFFNHFKEETCHYFQESQIKKKDKPVAVCGIKNCDLFSTRIQDFVFLGGVAEDHLYKTRRENMLIISSDCSSFKEVCFCRAFDINPHPAEGFDFNFSSLNDGFLVDVATPKARNILGTVKDIFTPATFGQTSGRSAKRESVIRQMEGHLAQHKIPKKEALQEITMAGYNFQLWQEESKTCVECGGCVFACDTCHCFLLSDEKSAEGNKRIRSWDGCLLKNFSRVAGGANPLKMRYMRLRNRYLKKFDFFIDNMDRQACCGCGRCIEVCPGKIDIRKILRRLNDEKHLPAA